MIIEPAELLKATLICGDDWYGAPWQKCQNCPLYDDDNCLRVLSDNQRIFIREYIANKTNPDFYGEDILK